MKNFKFTINGNTYDVNITKTDNNIAQVEVNGTSYSVEIHRKIVESKTPILVRSAVPGPTRRDQKIVKNITKGASVIKSPLPGIITHVSIKVGDDVKKGQKIMAMEAMKMENYVLAEKDGKVVSVKVIVGDSVLQNDVLCEIE